MKTMVVIKTTVFFTRLDRYDKNRTLAVRGSKEISLINQSKDLSSHNEQLYDFNMLIGYARVSTLDQNPNLQTDALKAAGCEKIIKDKISGTIAERPGLAQAKELLQSWRPASKVKAG